MTGADGVRRNEPQNVAWFARLAYAALGLGFVVSALEHDHVSENANQDAILITTAAIYLFSFFLIVQAQRGKNWARWVYLVLFIVNIPFYLPVLLDLFARNPMAGGLSLVQAIFQAVALVLVFTGDAKPFFAAKRPTA
ncbi:MAG: hypothetical protein U1F33_02080 [Alphaproteobacteria bacterium]